MASTASSVLHLFFDGNVLCVHTQEASDDEEEEDDDDYASDDSDVPKKRGKSRQSSQRQVRREYHPSVMSALCGLAMAALDAAAATVRRSVQHAVPI
jgi:hypothetical protein